MRVALVGIDGTGKTTVARLVAARGDVAVVHAIRPHEDPGSADAPLSRHLAAASAAADAAGRAQLKVAVLYLQLCLYGAAERRATAPVLLADRHPLVDPLVYLPLYARIGVDENPRDDVAAWWARQPPDTAAAVRSWLRACAGGTDVWTLGGELIRLAAKAPDDLLAELTRMFGVRLPDAVVLLDLPVTEALARTRDRRRDAELHETAAVLTAVRAGYDRVLRWLEPQVAVRRIDCSGRTADEIATAVGDEFRRAAESYPA
jgi:thymidylate kinase